MIHPSGSDPRPTNGVRDGQQGPVTCLACGCRLQASSLAGETSWHHFNPMAGRDARGCRIACADAEHDATGRPIVYTAA
jgi:transcription initiation factor TFIIIB Brf1 subunit/transcription initiation factor TFIIB